MKNETRIPGRGGSVTIVSDSYGQTVQVGPPDVSDDPTRWHPVTLDEAQTCKRYSATLDELLDWQRFGFPKPRTKQLVGRFSWTISAVRSWPVDELDRFDAQIRDLAARIPCK